jgi:uncharacterized membrane protein
LAGFSTLDIVAVSFFIVAWVGYHVAAEVLHRGIGLNAMMDEHRRNWIEQMLARENRIVDTTIMVSLQNGSAFFASTSLLAVGGVLALFRATEDVMTLFAEMPFGLATTRLAWEVKVVGLAVVFVYAFFKFAWANRIFNYAAILLGAVPQAHRKDAEATIAAAHRAVAMNIVGGRHFNRGQRAFFFSLGYLGWFVSPIVFMVATAGVLFVMWRRQFASDARAALGAGEAKLQS